jgi:hypothetical protein
MKCLPPASRFFYPGPDVSRELSIHPPEPVVERAPPQGRDAIGVFEHPDAPVAMPH